MNVWIILALMIAVSGVTIISGLLIIILERTSMIGILKALERETVLSVTPSYGLPPSLLGVACSSATSLALD